MKTLFIILGIALMGASTATAQTSVKPGGGNHDCIMATDANTLASLGLTADQTKRVEAIQAACKESHTAKTTDGIEQPAKVDHEAELKAVLTADQYAKWTSWCKERSMKSEKPEMKK